MFGFVTAIAARWKPDPAHLDRGRIMAGDTSTLSSRKPTRPLARRAASQDLATTTSREHQQRREYRCERSSITKKRQAISGVTCSFPLLRNAQRWILRYAKRSQDMPTWPPGAA